LRLANLDDFIKIIRGSKTREEARVKLLGVRVDPKQVERWSIFDSQRVTPDQGPYALTERQWTPFLDCACIN